MSVFEKKHTSNCHELDQYNHYENDSECAFLGFVPEGDLCAQSGAAAAGQRQQMQYDFWDARVIVDRPVFVEAVHYKSHQVDSDEVGIKKTNLQKVRQQKR